jgi:hypothetical protein
VLLNQRPKSHLTDRDLSSREMHKLSTKSTRKRTKASSLVRVDPLHQVVELLPGVLVDQRPKCGLAVVVGDTVVFVAGGGRGRAVAQSGDHLDRAARDAAVLCAAVFGVENGDLRGSGGMIRRRYSGRKKGGNRQWIELFGTARDAAVLCQRRRRLPVKEGRNASTGYTSMIWKVEKGRQVMAASTERDAAVLRAAVFGVELIRVDLPKRRDSVDELWV